MATARLLGPEPLYLVSKADNLPSFPSVSEPFWASQRNTLSNFYQLRRRMPFDRYRLQLFSRGLLIYPRIGVADLIPPLFPVFFFPAPLYQLDLVDPLGSFPQTSRLEGDQGPCSPIPSHGPCGVTPSSPFTLSSLSVDCFYAGLAFFSFSSIPLASGI